MKNLSKERVSELTRLYGELSGLQCSVEDAVSQYNDTLAELNSELEDIATDIQTYMDDCSDAWQESEESGAYQEWVSFFEDAKDEIYEPDFDHGDMEDVPLEVECV